MGLQYRAIRAASTAVLVAATVGVGGSAGLGTALAADPGMVGLSGIVVDGGGTPLAGIHLRITEALGPDGALWVATGDGNTGSSTYVGAGVYRLASPDTGTFTASMKIGGTELDSQIIRRILIDSANGRVFVAASRGLYSHSLTGLASATWTRVLAPCAQGMMSCTDVNESYRDIAYVKGECASLAEQVMEAASISA